MRQIVDQVSMKKMTNKLMVSKFFGVLSGSVTPDGEKLFSKEIGILTQIL